MSDIDYFDEPWDKPEPCATTDCDGVCDSPASGFCYDCRTAELIARANANARHQQELAAHGSAGTRATDRGRRAR